MIGNEPFSPLEIRICFTLVAACLALLAFGLHLINGELKRLRKAVSK